MALNEMDMLDKLRTITRMNDALIRNMKAMSAQQDVVIGILQKMLDPNDVTACLDAELCASLESETTSLQNMRLNCISEAKTILSYEQNFNTQYPDSAVDSSSIESFIANMTKRVEQ